MAIISTFAGANPFDTLNDGGLATLAAIGGPEDVYIDPAGDFFISDSYFDRVRELPLLRPAFQVSSASLAFTAQAGSAPLSQRIDVTGGVAGIPFTVASSESWLTVSLPSGNMPSGMDITADPSGLAAGSYQGTVTITASDDGNDRALCQGCDYRDRGGAAEPGRQAFDAQFLYSDQLSGGDTDHYSFEPGWRVDRFHG